MANKLVGKLAQVNSTTARNPGGYGRITRTHRRMYRVDSSEFPGQEVTGWYTAGELVILTSEPQSGVHSPEFAAPAVERLEY